MKRLATTLFSVLVLRLAGVALAAEEPPKYPVKAGPVATPELRREILAADHALFAAVFDTCDLQALAGLIADDFEFFHDKHGQIASGPKEFLGQIRKGCELQAAGTNVKARRELVEESLEVYPMNELGAIEIGVHRFYGIELGKSDQLRETGKFFHLWKKVDGRWRLARVFSYDHRPAS